ncbi:hypothetical protein ABPG75_002474 [Micractinium tetrahymenae]
MSPSSDHDASQHGAQEPQQDAAMKHILSGAKRKELEVPKKRTSFKGVANLVLAMKRFSNAINPTYSYGKRPTSSCSGGKPATDDQEAVSRPRPTSPTTLDDKYAYQDRGHRFDFLLKPLPPTEEEEAVAPRQ